MIPARLFRMGPAEIAGRRRPGAAQAARPARARREAVPGPGVLGALAPDAALDAVRARVRAGDLDGARALLLERFLEAAPATILRGRGEPGRTRRASPARAPGRSGARRRGGIGARRALRPARLSRPVLRRSDRLAPRSGESASGPRSCTGADVDFLDAGRVGDSKVVWELNRHQWLVRLGQAYRMTGDERYAERFAATIVEWTRANPPGVGINWASSLEVAFRIISWSWAADAVPRIAGARARTVRRDPRGRGRVTPPTWSAISRATSRRTRTSPARPSACSMPVWCFPSCAARGGGSALGRRILVDEVDSAGAARRVPLRAVDLLPPLHGRDLPALRAARGAERRAGAARGRRAARRHGRRAPGAPRARRLDAGDRRRRRRLAPAAGAAARRRPPRRVCRGRGGVPEAGLRVGRGRPAAPEVLWLLRPRALRRRVAGAAGPRDGAPRAVGRGRLRRHAQRVGSPARISSSSIRARSAAPSAAVTVTPISWASSARSSASPPRGSRHLLLHGGAGVARLLPRHRGPLDGDEWTASTRRCRAGPSPGRHGRARGSCAGSPRTRSTSPTPSTTPTRGSPTP